MGAVFSVLDSCGPSSLNTPSSYIEYELERESRFVAVNKRKRMDVMGTAMSAAMSDIKGIMGIH
jgi:hypothetical protein